MKKILKALICALLALLMITMCACNRIEPEEPTEAPTEAPTLVKAVRAKVSIAAGTSIAVKDVEVVEVYSNEIPGDYLAKATDASGRRLLVDVAAGEFIAESMLEAKVEVDNSADKEVDESVAREKGYVVITDYVDPISGVDLSADIQKVIDENPNATIYFPDGTYCISSPILTSSDPTKAVSLHMSNYAILKADSTWKDTEHHMVRLGAKDKSFDIDTVGSNYYFYGGMIDGSYVAKGISVEGGRETSVRYISMKNVTQGLHIMYNEQCPSSNVDVQTVNIVGCYNKDSIGVLVDGYDNTLTNMRVASFQVAIKLTGARNTLRNLHMLWRYNDSKYDYEDSVGFWDTSAGNTYDICYPDNFAIGFRMSGHTVSVYNNCYGYWYSGKAGETQIGFWSDGKFNSIIKHCRMDLRDEKIAKYLVVAEEGGTGVVEYPVFPSWRNQDNAYSAYLVGRVIWS